MVCRFCAFIFLTEHIGAGICLLTADLIVIGSQLVATVLVTMVRQFITHIGGTLLPVRPGQHQVVTIP